uniref:Protein FAM47A-like n=1 Tax=Urocitellus parryii TaxID=9999 RepID=A0A8D2I326_UROPR|nr:protein FAM47A-like [Urocitellus parryii]
MAEQKWRFRPWILEPLSLGMTSKPWYDDRLSSRCFAKQKKKLLKFPTSLDSRRWVFVKEGLDDFRNGCPSSEDLITRGRSHKEAFLPTISHRVPQPAPRKSRKKSKNAGLFSTLSRAQLARKAFVADVEASLTQHPLAHYPNLEEDLPAEILLKVLEVLDPDRKLEDTWAYCEGHGKGTKEPCKVSKRCTKRSFPEPPKISGSNKKILIHEEDKSSKKDLPPSQGHKHIPKGISDFCQWVATFGDMGIDEEFMMQQVDIDYECQPTYNDYHIKKINLLPSDLKYCSQLNKVKEIRFSIQELDFERKLHKFKNPYKPDWVKIRYGAWYLKPKLWRKLVNDEPLIDPKVLRESQKPHTPKPDIIDDLYGTIAFKDFIMSKGYSMPDILKKLFIRKGWNYDSVKTPIPKAIKVHESTEDEDEDDDDDDDD